MVRVQPLDCDFSLEAPERNRRWYEERGYESASTALFRTVATGADVILDIGAHVGYYSLLGKSAAPDAHVVAVEASPVNAQVLKRNVDSSAHPDIDVVVAAFAAKSGTAMIQLTEASDNSGFGGHPNSPTEESVEVPAVTAADLSLPHGERIVIKLDVEGYELDALRGLESAFDRYGDVRMLVEMNPKCLVRAGVTGDDLVERLTGYGFRLFVLDESSRAWRELRAGADWTALIDPASYANLYCVRADRCRTVSAVLHSGGVTGAQRSHVEMVERLVAQGFMVHTVVAEPALGIEHELVRCGGSVDVVPHMPWWSVPPVGSETGPDAWLNNDFVQLPLIDSLALVDADVVLSQSGVIPQGAIAASALRKPHVWYLREYVDLDHGLVPPAGDVAQMGALIETLSAVVVANSAAVAAHLFGTHAERVVVVSPVPSLEASTPPRAGASAGPIRVGIVASLNLRKGQEDAVRAISILRELGVEIELDLIGPASDPDRQRVEQLAAERGIADHVYLRGAIADRDEVYRDLDVVAVTSHAEAFGRVPFEATSYGVPVVYANVGGPAEYLRDGVTGLSYVARDVESLAIALRRLVDEPGLGQKLAKTAAGDLLNPVRAVEYDSAVRAFLDQAVEKVPTAFAELVGSVARSAVAGQRWRASASAAEADLARVASEHDDLVATHAALTAQHGALVEGHLGYVEMHEGFVVERDGLVQQLRDSGEANAALRAELSESRHANAALRTELGDALDARASADVRAAEEGSRRADAEARLALIEGSRTWRARMALRRTLRR
ncbi:FkbM family methyltransferase [Cellulomonas sp. URHE0023]|uniref:FkbM family methyltransferase n=1 Tax=Cellulomonas sp. URHE0023 TaxID=1380354 RepID=UPI000486C400|nr:FkbM family methyltransferase [Cellulomonas sp. URHE0023]